MSIRIPKYTLAEELWNSISHGLAAIFAIVATVLMIVKADTALEYVTVSIFGTTMIILYAISCVYHALSRRLTGKKVLRVIDHCNVFLLVLGTYTPIALLGVGGALGWWLFAFVTLVTIVGITLSAVNTDRFQIAEVICHLLNGWSILIGIKPLYERMGFAGILLLLLGGLAYTLGAILYGVGAKHRYVHSVFHFFCIAGTVLQWLSIYLCLL
jgi:hemolysin III